MKLRRAFAAMAATAALAPLALLAAPAAFADADPGDTSSASASTSASPETTPETDAPSTAETGTDAGTDTNAGAGTGTDTDPADGSGSGSNSDTGSDSDSSSGSDDANGTDQQDAQTSTTATATTTATTTATPTGTPTGTTTPTDPPTYEEPCPVDDDGEDPDSALTLAVSGLPGTIVAGSGWHNFSLTAANHSDASLGDIQWLAAVDNYSDSDDEKDWLSTYAQLEYFNPVDKQWESIADEVGNGYYFGETELGAHETVEIKFRVNIGAKAPAGDGYALGFGGYSDAAKECFHTAFALYDFTVLKPGSSNDNPGDAQPGKGTAPAGGKSPQGGADEIPANGSLASTGSSSALPMIALVGGAAGGVGGGAVFAVRRRTGKGGDTAA
ncbi:hypothetical protein OK074_6408 [Actinobacteria bacterium OK074]|nr:hypothetical protein OK074_6408 [Actinobacteria bacterium OK074]